MATYYWVGGTGTWSGTGNTQFAATSGGVATLLNPTNADTVNFDANSGTAATVTVTATAVSLSTTINKSDINISLSGSPTLCTAAGTLTLTTGTITLNNNILTVGIFNGNNANTKAIAFGTGSVTLTGNNGIIWNTATTTGFTYTGTPSVISNYSGSTGTRTLRHGTTAAGNETNSPSFAITAGTDTVLFTTPCYAKDVIFTGFAGTWTNSSQNIYGNLTVSSGMTVGAGAVAVGLVATSGTQLITTNAKTLDFPISLGTSGTPTWRLEDALTMGSGRTLTFNVGTLNLNSKTLTTGLFSSSTSTVRSIGFGTGNITLIGSGTVWNTGTVTNFSYTGTPTVNVSNNSATATTVTTGAMTEAQSLNFNYTVGTYTLTDTSSVYKSLNFTGFTGTIPNSVRTIYGNLTLVSGMTLTAGANATTFAATSGTNTITTAAKTLDFPLTFNGVGGTFAFQDALTQGSTRAFTITNGTVQLKASATSTVGAFATSGSTQKNLQSTTSGTKATLSQASGTVSASYLTIQDIAATGGAVWNAYTTSNNIDAGNNSGWDFSSQTGRYIYTRRKNKRILP
jgi:hypothetical protein